MDKEQFVEVTLHGFDALCIDLEQTFFRRGHPETYTILCRVPGPWVGLPDLQERLYRVAEYVNVEQSNALIREGGAVGHHLLQSITFRLVDDDSPVVAKWRYYFRITEDGGIESVRFERA